MFSSNRRGGGVSSDSVSAEGRVCDAQRCEEALPSFFWSRSPLYICQYILNTKICGTTDWITLSIFSNWVSSRCNRSLESRLDLGFLTPWPKSSLEIYVHLCFNRWQYEHTGFSPGHLVFFFLNRIRLWAVDPLRVMALFCLPTRLTGLSNPRLVGYWADLIHSGQVLLSFCEVWNVECSWGRRAGRLLHARFRSRARMRNHSRTVQIW